MRSVSWALWSVIRIPIFLSFELVDNTLNVFHRNRVDTAKGSSSIINFGIYSQTAGNLGAAAFASRQLVAEVPAHFLQTELCDKALELVALLLASSLKSSGTRHVYCPSTLSLRNTGCLLRKIADAVLRTLIYRNFVILRSLRRYAPFVRLDKSLPSCRRLWSCRRRWGPRRPTISPLGNVYRYMVYYSAFAVYFHQIVGAENHALSSAW